MKTVSLIIFLAGFVLCPGYLIYVTGFSGSNVGEFKFIDKDISSFSVGPLTTTSTGGDRAEKENSIRLSPEMNPIRIIAKAKYLPDSIMSQRTKPQRAKCQLSFYKETDQLWTENFEISHSKPRSGKNKKGISINAGKSVSQAIKLITVDEDAVYNLRLNQLSKPRMKISDLSIQVRANVAEANSKVWGTGAALILASILGFVLSAFVFKTQPVQ